MLIITRLWASRQQLRRVLSGRTATLVAAAYFGHHLGGAAPGSLADTLSVGLTVAAIAYAITFALTERLRRSISPTEMLNRDRELLRYSNSTLRRAVLATLVVLAYIGLNTSVSPESHVMKLLAPASAATLGWLLCSIPQMYARFARNINGLDDEYPDLDGFWKSPRRYRQEAVEDLRQTADGWRIDSRRVFARQNSGPSFVSREMAVRYGALEAEARLHYVQLCDRPEQAEAADRVERIAVCLEQMERLSDLEQRIRRLLSNDEASLRSLIRP